VKWFSRWKKEKAERVHSLGHVRPGCVGSTMVEIGDKGDVSNTHYVPLGHQCYQARIAFRCYECGEEESFLSFKCTREWMEKNAPAQLCEFDGSLDKLPS
jgi:hypothetical protein